MTMNIQHIVQEDPSGCLIACLAMVRGVDYYEVKAEFYGDFENEGIAIGKAMDYLADYGYSIIYRRSHSTHHPKLGHKYMTEPFADVHIVEVKDFADTNHSHGVVMLKDGTIYNPRKNGVDSLEPYYEVISCVGIWHPATANLFVAWDWANTKDRMIVMADPEAIPAPTEG